MEEQIPPTPPTSSPPPPAVPATPAPPQPTAKLKTFWFVVLGLVLVVGVLFAGIVLGQKGFLSGILPSRQPLPTPTTIAQPTPTPDPTADWKTYSNSEGKFSVKYPTEWTVKDLGSLGSITQNVSNVVLEADEYKAQITISVSDTDTARKSAEGEQKQSGEKFSLDGTMATKWLESKEKKAQGYVLAIKGDRVYSILFECLSQECFETDKQYYLNIFNQILSTFKFLNEKGSQVTLKPTIPVLRIPQKKVDTSSWISKSYPKLFISFKVPSSWEEKGEAEFSVDNLVRRVMFDDPNRGLSFDFAVSLYNNPRGLSRREFWSQQFFGPGTSFSEHAVKYVKDINEWNIDGKSALSLFFTEYSGGGTYFMIPRGNQMIVLFFREELSQNDNFETIVSTVKFIN
ncbi:MAG TPA: PsbP-related protein [Patescibacteria group bacterium]|nr:PsbP-related protein [Patescibacteria group bacterium]